MIESLDLMDLRAREQTLTSAYDRFRAAGLTLDLTRGKPSGAQLALSDPLDAGNATLVSADGTDVRNYGGLDGLPEARALGGELLGVAPTTVIAGGNSSLTLMYLYLMNAWLYGPVGPGSAWRDAGPVRFLCPVPGYDRHFTILEDLGIEMINVPMLDDGPDMDRVEEHVRTDPAIRGIWCVPKYSNPGGQVYSDRTIERLARLASMASPHFRVMYDNAYAVHDLDHDPPELPSAMEAFTRQNTTDSLVLFGSTSKITRAGAGIAFIASSPANLDQFRRRMRVFTIGPDKVNQFRHVHFLRDLDGIRAHMRKHAAILRPKFDLVQRRLTEALTGAGMGSWTTPRGGYFLSFDTSPGLAKEVVRLASAAGVKLTPAGATFPYRRDPDDANIRLAPTFPDLADLDQAMQVFVVCVQLATVRQALAARGNRPGGKA
ncbi:MAG: aminotransferase class I/II-fold pyridoxal phosphate-dependent enzyme [Acidobacteriota bacterium]|nr:aminotransferase class I/II-fold pyridoxal phosphate-dependent enzyme [Acidobacteriota bacterium]